MKIAVMSDSHDHLWNLRKAAEKAQDLGCHHIIHLGDLISPFMLEEIESYKGTFHLIYGNNNGDQFLLDKKMAAMNNKVIFHGLLGELELEGKRLGFIHDPMLADKIAKSGDYDLVMFGHTHRWLVENRYGCLILNPGEILGKKEPAGFALVTLPQLEIEHIIL